MLKALTLLTLVLIVVAPTAGWAEFTARVIGVHEGDRLTIFHGGRTETIALKGIDCPALKQPYGKQARNATAAFVGNREVIVRSLLRDRQGLTTAEVRLQDGRNIAYELVREGLAWSRGGTADGQNFDDEEELARAAGKGLWADPHPVPPWKWKAPNKTSRKFSD